jgi:hypothetical protein
MPGDGVTVIPTDVINDAFDWRRHRVDPRRLEESILTDTKTIRPWLYPRSETGSSINYPVSFKTLLFSRDEFVSHFEHPIIGTDWGMSVKEFSFGFPSLPKEATKSEIFEYLSQVCRYALGGAVYVPPIHTYVETSEFGAWWDYVPDIYKERLQYYDVLLRNLLVSKQAYIIGTPSLAHLVKETSGYRILWWMAYHAGHPALVPGFSDVLVPTQGKDESLTDYMQKWQHYLHVECIQGTFLSDRYFLETFVRGMNSVYNGNLKAFLYHSVRRVPVNSPVPAYYSPKNLLEYIRTLAVNIGLHNLELTQTPKEFADERRRPSTRSRHTSDNSTLSSRSSSTATIRAVEVDFLEDDDLVTIYSLMASNTTRKCDLCESPDHLIAKCPQIETYRRDPHKLRRLLRALQDARTPDDASKKTGTTNSSSAPSNDTRSRTPTRSNASRATVNQLTGDDTDDDVTISQLSDGGTDGSLTDNEGDF